MTRRRKLGLGLVGLTIGGLVWGGYTLVRHVRNEASRMADT
jgi:hypothetical protein